MSDQLKRFDERVLTDFRAALQAILKTYPDFAAAAIVVAYKVPDHGSLPAFAVEWDGPTIRSDDLLKICTAMDQAGLALRREHDQAVAKFTNGLVLKKEQETNGEKDSRQLEKQCAAAV